ncbi:MAG: thymidine kinase [Candidatus Marinimicrobia bacterium]|nr:thymidine kinase [Candidatus Neomarinimicrobiota bacterium]
MTLTPKNAGWIEVICGSMFSGKTEELIRRIRRAEIAKMSTIIFKPQIDDRFSSNHVVSHNQSKRKSKLVKNAQEILNQATNMDVIGIDEAQFFDDNIVNVCKSLAKINKRVVVAGLDKDFRGNSFGPMPALMCEADYLDKLRAICLKCGNPASCSQRITKDSQQVVIGEANIYEARCRNCFEAPEH